MLDRPTPLLSRPPVLRLRPFRSPLDTPDTLGPPWSSEHPPRHLPPRSCWRRPPTTSIGPGAISTAFSSGLTGHYEVCLTAVTCVGPHTQRSAPSRNGVLPIPYGRYS